MGKQLKRSSNKMIAGVAAGVAEYFDIDVTIVRIIWAVLAFACFCRYCCIPNLFTSHAKRVIR